MKRLARTLAYERRLEVCAEHYGNSIRAVFEDVEACPGLHVHVLAFEALLREPEARLRDVCRFVGLDFRPEMLPAEGDRLPIGSRYPGRTLVPAQPRDQRCVRAVDRLDGRRHRRPSLRGPRREAWVPPPMTAGSLAAAAGLLRGLRLRRKSDVARRVLDGALRASGLLRARFPEVTPDPDDLVRALHPGVAGPPPASSPTSSTTAPARGSTSTRATRTTSWHGTVSNAPACRWRTASWRDAPVVAGLGSVEVGQEVDWHQTLLTPARWPRRHWTRIRFQGSGVPADVKACWDWSRHHDFVTLGHAYRHTGDDRYVRRFVALLDSWCAQNPPEVGVHWISNLEIGLRCVSWLWAHHLMAPSPAYPRETRVRLHLWILHMARRLARRLGYTAWTGRHNHLVGDLSCLAVVALSYPEWKEAAGWRRKALSGSGGRSTSRCWRTASTSSCRPRTGVSSPSSSSRSSFSSSEPASRLPPASMRRCTAFSAACRGWSNRTGRCHP